MKLRTNKKIAFIFINLLVLIILFYIGFLNVYHIYKDYVGIDFNIYSTIYEKPYHDWYESGSLFYYSPLFYILFIPFHVLSYEIYFIIGLICYCWGLLQCVRKLNPIIWFFVSLNLAFQFWIYFNYGNIDLLLFGIITQLFIALLNPENKQRKWYNDERTIAFLLGICTFKGTVGYIFLIFLLVSKEKRSFIFFFFIGVFLNYFWLIFDFVQLNKFLIHITLNDHPDTNIYLLGLHYPWLWGTIALFIQNIDVIKAKSHKPHYRRIDQDVIQEY